MKDELYIDFPRIIKEVIRNWYWLVLSVVLVTGITFARTVNTPVKYVAQATLYSSVYGSTKESVQQADYLSTYTELIYTEKVCERARVILGSNTISAAQIQSMISVSTGTDSVVIRISASNYDPVIAVDVANAVAKSFEIEAKSITGDTTLQMLDEAQYAYLSGRAPYVKSTLIAFVISLLVPVVIIALKEIFSDNVYHVEDAGLSDELDIIGIIPMEKNV